MSLNWLSQFGGQVQVGVQEFGKKLGVTFVNEKQWHNILEEVNKAIKALPKDPATIALCEVSANLYAVKVAWRNEVMHPKDTLRLSPWVRQPVKTLLAVRWKTLDRPDNCISR